MGQTAAILFGIVIGVGVVGAAVAAVNAVRAIMRDVRGLTKAVQKTNELLAASIEASNTVAASIQKMNAQASDMNGYITGFVKVCEAMVGQFEKVSESVNGLCNLIAPKNSAEDSFAPYREETADLAWRKQSFIAQGYTEEEATALAKADERANILYNPSL